MVCTFFGHRDASPEIASRLRTVVLDLIQHKNVNMFYVGNQGRFDTMVRRILKEAKMQYPHIQYAIILAYMPNEKEKNEDFSDTIYPEGLETVPRQVAIVARNRWMVEKADYVVSYVTTTVGGAAHFTDLAEKKGKEIIRLQI